MSLYTTECSAVGSAPALGAGCRRFESCRSEMSTIFYSILSLIASILGSISGIGGGVIVKPIMDLVGDFNVVTISLLSSITVFSMSVVSLIKSRGKSDIQDEPWSSTSRLVLLGLGSIAGGFVGQEVFNIIFSLVQSDYLMKIIQNSLLLVIIVIVFVFMILSDKIKKYKFTSHSVYVIAGIFLGIVAAFLGIGGGPMNVALLMLLFSFDVKTSMFGSILIIFFSQFSKLALVLFTTGFATVNFQIAIAMIMCAIVGGFIGTWIKKVITSKAVTMVFNCVQIFIMATCIMNIIKSINAL